MNVPVENLIPHRAPMRLINALTHCDDTCARAVARFDADHFAVSQGLVTEAALVECIAQTVAAALGFAAKGEGKPSVGMLTAVTDFEIQMRPAAGQTLEIEIHEVKRLRSMRMINGRITSGGRLVAQGDLMVHA